MGCKYIIYIIKLVGASDFFLRNRIITASAPWITGEDTLQCQPTSFERTMFPDSLYAIVGASGRIAAGAANERRERPLVHFDEEDHHGANRF